MNTDTTKKNSLIENAAVGAAGVRSVSNKSPEITDPPRRSVEQIEKGTRPKNYRYGNQS